MNDLIAGHIQVYHGGLASVFPLIRSGKMKALGVSSRERAPAAPDIPAIAETVPGFEATIWYGILGPVGMPPAIVSKLNAEINAVMRDPEVVKRLETEAVQPANASPEVFAKFVTDEVVKWGEVAKAARMTVQP